MSKLTDKIEALIQWNSDKGIPGGQAVSDLRDILADVQELERKYTSAQDAIVLLFAAEQTARREAYQHAIRIVRSARWERKTKRSVIEGVLCAAIDALDVEGVVK